MERPADPTRSPARVLLVTDSQTVLEQYLGGTPEQAPEQYRQASPRQLIGPDAPPTLLIQGAADTMVGPPHSQRLLAAMQAAGRACQLVLVPLATHGSDYNFSGAFGQISTYAVERFLCAVMG